MTERPINFDGDMVRAIMAGRKTQMRMPVDPQPVFIHAQDGWGPLMHIPGRGVWFNNAPSDICPYGVPGDRLLMRAMPNFVDPDADIMLEITSVKVARVKGITDPEAIAEGACELNHVGDDPTHSTWTMGSGMERYDSPRKAFAAEWDSIYANRGLGWDANPWVWVVKFKQIDERK